jgi:signal transduction histidine kinase
MPVVASEIARDYLIAIGSVAVVFVLTILLTTFVDTDVSTVYLAAVMYASWRRGLAAGLVATFLSVVLATYFFLPPVYSFSLKAEGLVELIVFSLAAIVISYLSASRERALALESAARQESEAANRVKDDFLATVSHELRTPLTTIKALARLLTRDDLSNDKRRDYLDTISVECDRQIELVLNLLDVSKIEGGALTLSMEKVDATEMITSCVKSQTIAAERRGHKLDVNIGPADIPPICADAKALRRIVTNLIENAIKYTPDGGAIMVSAASENEFVAISVSDNGRGIRAEDLPLLFDKFHRGKQVSSAGDSREDVDVSGVGLGLYLAKNLTQRMGGTIGVETGVGSGSTFTIRLPVWDDAKCKVTEDEDHGETTAGS